MDASTTIAANTQTVVRAGKTLAGACTQICQYEPRRLLLIISSRISTLLFQPCPPGDSLDASVPLTRSISLPAAGATGSTIVLNQADHGPLVQAEWWADIDAGSLDWTVIEVLDMGCIPRPVTSAGEMQNAINYD